jgi:hypothetical protein
MYKHTRDYRGRWTASLTLPIVRLEATGDTFSEAVENLFDLELAFGLRPRLHGATGD